MTAKEFILLNTHTPNEEMLIKFAKLKCKEQIEAILNIDISFKSKLLQKLSITNAYPLKSIK